MSESIFSEVQKQELRLGLPNGFFALLLKEDDWSFVIKLNALVEAACSDALAARLHTPELVECLATLDLGHNKHGKVALLRNLGAIAKEQAVTLQLLYELRNQLAHNIGKVNFSFEEHLSNLDDKARKSFADRAGHGIWPTVHIKDVVVPREQFVLENPKFALWLTVAEILACLHLEHEFAKVRLHRLALQSLAALRASDTP